MRWMCRNTFSRTCPESKPNTLYIGLKLCLSRDNLSPRVTIDVNIVEGHRWCDRKNWQWCQWCPLRARAKAQNFLNWCKLFMYISSWNWVGPGCIVPWDFLGPIPSTSNLGTNIILKPPVNVSQSVLVYFQVYSICLDVLRVLFLWS